MLAAVVEEYSEPAGTTLIGQVTTAMSSSSSRMERWT